MSLQNQIKMSKIKTFFDSILNRKQVKNTMAEEAAEVIIKPKFNNRIINPHFDFQTISTFAKFNARNNRLFRDRRKAAQSYLFKYSLK